jgi:hypothetical protein
VTLDDDNGNTISRPVKHVLPAAASKPAAGYTPNQAIQRISYELFNANLFSED